MDRGGVHVGGIVCGGQYIGGGQWWVGVISVTRGDGQRAHGFRWSGAWMMAEWSLMDVDGVGW